MFIVKLFWLFSDALFTDLDAEDDDDDDDEMDFKQRREANGNTFDYMFIYQLCYWLFYDRDFTQVVINRFQFLASSMIQMLPHKVFNHF